MRELLERALEFIEPKQISYITDLVYRTSPTRQQELQEEIDRLNKRDKLVEDIKKYLITNK